MRTQKEWLRFAARHTLDIFGGTEKEVGLPGAANNTGDDACALFEN